MLPCETEIADEFVWNEVRGGHFGFQENDMSDKIRCQIWNLCPKSRNFGKSAISDCLFMPRGKAAKANFDAKLLICPSFFHCYSNLTSDSDSTAQNTRRNEVLAKTKRISKKTLFGTYGYRQADVCKTAQKLAERAFVTEFLSNLTSESDSATPNT